MQSVVRETGRWVQTHKQRSLVILLMATFMMVIIFSFSASSGLATLDDKVVYKVVLDAGSTGTRIHVFEFLNTDVGHSPILRNYPLFAKQDGGLSDFADEPGKVASGLELLIEQAKGVIPEHMWGMTEVLLMATAGLRLLPEHQADALLAVAANVLSISPFQVRTVDIIEGKSEAKYIYLMAAFVSDSKQMAIVDLGGGSVQLAYTDPKMIPTTSYEKQFIESGGMYLNSWLGFGLVAFRMKALEMIDDAHPCVPPWTPKGTVYQYAGKERAIVPRQQDDAEMHACIDIVKEAIKGENGQCSANFFSKGDTALPMCGLNDEYIGPVSGITEWRVFSYIFDLAKEEGMVEPDQHEASLTPKDFFDAAKIHCENTVMGTKPLTDWWKCVDLVYVGVLLTDGFGLPETTSVKVTKKLIYRNRLELEAAWPLGAALEALASAP